MKSTEIAQFLRDVRDGNEEFRREGVSFVGILIEPEGNAIKVTHCTAGNTVDMIGAMYDAMMKIQAAEDAHKGEEALN